MPGNATISCNGEDVIHIVPAPETDIPAPHTKAVVSEFLDDEMNAVPTPAEPVR